MTLAIVVVASQQRSAHLATQQRLLDELARPDVMRIVAWLGPEEAPRPHGVDVVRVPSGAEGLPVGAGRNAAAGAAIERGADVLVFLDADCLAGPRLIERYEAAAGRHPEAILSGPVTYLDEHSRPRSAAALPALTRPHPARPEPGRDTERMALASEYDLFWSLSFAMTAATWTTVGGFDEQYVGYGAEDTDFAYRARLREVPLVWVGGAHAYHQWHPTSVPPWQHLDDILRNGALFAARWGRWPMRGWLDAFAEAGAIRWEADRWVRT